MFAGIAGGLAATHWLANRDPISSERPSVVDLRPVAVSTSPGSAEPSSRAALDALQQRVSEMERRMTSADGGTSSASVSHLEEEARISHEQDFARELQEYSAEPTDSQWSHRASNDISSMLSSLTMPAGSHLISAECRTTLCLVEFEWSDHASAQASYLQLVQAPFQTRCARKIGLFAAESQVPYRAQMILNCEEDRGVDR